MVATSTIRVTAWTISLATAGAAFGMDWAIQPVEIPLWALLVVTFVPTRALVDAALEIIDALVQKFTPADTSSD